MNFNVLSLTNVLTENTINILIFLSLQPSCDCTDTPSVQFNTPNHTFVPKGSSNEITCLVDSRAPPNITWFYMQDGGQITKTCNAVTQCSVLVSGLQKGETRTYVCTVETVGRKLSISLLAEGTGQI
ncbi:hypothetical protein DPMN_079502 [Dreissena polymorpha]|uniref:Ig-like domain-containing protein n=1 Tax=Dreissena polymorpha TaxID=45954 RepID=A0A9D4BR98_DREPO|nr:hypothetical protein DPMN_079502 [Dreissena polymorpha]